MRGLLVGAIGFCLILGGRQWIALAELSVALAEAETQVDSLSQLATLSERLAESHRALRVSIPHGTLVLRDQAEGTAIWAGETARPTLLISLDRLCTACQRALPYFNELSRAVPCVDFIGVQAGHLPLGEATEAWSPPVFPVVESSFGFVWEHLNFAITPAMLLLDSTGDVLLLRWGAGGAEAESLIRAALERSCGRGPAPGRPDW